MPWHAKPCQPPFTFKFYFYKTLPWVTHDFSKVFQLSLLENVESFTLKNYKKINESIFLHSVNSKSF